MKSDANCMWNVSGSVRSMYTQDGAVLLDIDKGLCYSLNVVAAKVWNALDERPKGIDFTGLVDAVGTHFDVPRERLETDITEHLAKLEKMGLVRRSPQMRSQASS
jgi:hypothetical protein